MIMLKRLKQTKPFYSFIGLLILISFMSLIIPEFRTIDNAITVFRQASILLILSAGLTTVIIAGNIDLSIGSTAGFVGCICARLLKMHISIPVVFLLGIGICVLVGLFNGLLVGVIKLPAFIATFATNWVLGGISIIVMQGGIIHDLPENFTYLGTGYIGPMPVIILIAIVVVLFVFLILQKSVYGRNMYVLGSNPAAAFYSAVPVARTISFTFILSAISAGIGGLMMVSRLNAAEAAMSDSYGLQPVAAVVIGGTSMLGGEGGVVGTVIGALLLTVIVNIMNLLGISSNAQPMAVGFVILATVLFDAWSRTRQEGIYKIRRKRRKDITSCQN